MAARARCSRFDRHTYSRGHNVTVRTAADIAYCLHPPLRLCTYIYHAFNTLETHTFLFQIMVAFLSYISNACHSLSGVAERLQHTVGDSIQTSTETLIDP